MEERGNFEKLYEDAKDYLDSKIELSKLQAIDKGSELAGSATVGIILLVLFTMVFLFGSIALSFCLGEMSGSTYKGFLIVSIIYFIIGLIVYFARNAWIKTPITNLFIKKILKDDEDN